MKSWLVPVLLVVLAVFVVMWLPRSTLIADPALKGTITGTLTGALVGAAGSMLGANLNRIEARGERREERSEDKEAARAEKQAAAAAAITAKAEHTAKVRALVTQELAITARGHLNLTNFLHEVRKHPAQWFGIRLWPVSDLALTRQLGLDLLIFQPAEVETLTKLLGHLRITVKRYNDTIIRDPGPSPHDVNVLINCLDHDKELLMTAFRLLAPDSAIEVGGKRGKAVDILSDWTPHGISGGTSTAAAKGEA